MEENVSGCFFLNTVYNRYTKQQWSKFAITVSKKMQILMYV